MSDKQLEVLQTVVAMFNAAPGARYLNEFVLFLDNTGSSVKELASFLAQTDVFKQSLYSDTLSNTEFADQFVNNTAGLLVSKEDKAWAASEIVKMLDAGESRGDVLYWAATALASIDFTNIHWGATAQQFNHKIEVAAFYSIDQSGSATSLSVLQQVTEKVTNDISTVTAIKTLLASNNAGKVIDGYVKKALVFADLNGDHLLNPEEASSITDAFGNFFLPSIIGFGDLIASGGIDIATGMPFEGIMTAPAGATVITPLTTLVDKIVQDNAISVQSAVIKVLASLDLNTSIDLLHFDPIKEAIRTDIYPTEINNALKIHVASVQIQILVSQIAALLHGAGIAPDETTAIDWAYDTLAAMVGNSTDRIPLTSKSIIVKVIVGAAQLSGVDEAVLLKSAGLLADASQSIANLNLSIINTSQNSGNKLKILANIAAVQIVSENIEADMESGAAKGNVASTVRSTTGALFTNAITKAGSKVGDVNGDGKSDAHLLLPSSGGGSPAPSTNIFYLATNATAFSGTAANDILSISTASTWTPLIMTAVVLNGGAGINTISVQDGSSIALATVLNFTNLIFDATGVVGANNVTMSAAQHQNFTGTITALGTGVNGEQITISGDGNITTLADIETYVLEDDSTNARALTLGPEALILVANNADDTITVDAANLEQNTVLTLGASASSLIINSLVGDIDASNLTGALIITTADAADNGISITTGSAATSVDVAAGAATDTVSIDATALANNTTLTITSAAAAAGSVNISNLTGDLTVSDPASGAISVTVTNNTIDDEIAIVAGTSNLVVNNVADGDTVTITGFAGSTLTGAIAGATGKFNITAGTATSSIMTGAGDDTFTFAAVTGLTSGDIVDGGAGTDTVALTGNTAFTATNDFDNVQNIEVITLGNTNTAVTITTQDTLVASGATLTLSNAANSGALTFNGAAETDGAFNITGGSGIDNITGSSGNDTLTGNNGNDSMTAGLGDDTLSGGTGNDTFTFAAVSGLTSADTVDGGTGTDTVALTGNTAFTATNDFDNVKNIEVITLQNTDTDVTIITLDTLVASGATLTLTNAANSGVLTFNGAAETNGTFNITGGSGNDNIIAGAGNNTLAGGAGDDTFTFVAGTGLTTDTVNGGTGTDTVVLTGTTAVTATQFNNVSNIEFITLSDMVNTAVAITTVNALVAAGATLTLSNAANSGVLTFNGAAEADGNFNITGGTGNDIITGGSGSDIITGGNGNDSMTAGLGNDTLSGDTGNDTFTFAAVTGLTSADIVDGGTGTDTVALTGNTAFTAANDFDNVQNIEAITLANTNTAVTITTKDTLVAAGATLTLSNAANSGILTFNGAAETDGTFNITGGSGNDIITGGSGNDTLSGGNGANSITAGLGDDTLSGGTGNDTFTFAAVSGLTSADTVDGGTGTDTVALTGNTAFTATNDFDNVKNIEVITLQNTDTDVTIITQDTLVASGATLTLTNAANSGVLTFNGAAETNGTFNITGGSGNDNIIAGAGNNTLAGGAGDDTFTFVAGTGLTTDTVNGGTGTDTVVLTGTTAVTATQFNNVSNIELITLSDMVNTAVAITTVNALVAAGATLTLSNVANSGVLTFNGAAEADGNFNITGGTGNDIITGGSGSDIITGGNGNDSMTAGLGNDTLSGDAGNDTFTFAAVTGLTSADIVDGGAGTDTVALTGNTAFTATNDFDNVQNIEVITLGNTNTAVTITTQDTLVAAGAILTLSTANTGGLTFNGAAETDGAFNITSSGLSNDTITGGAGADSIVAGTGTDTIAGGGGNDTFTFAAGTGLTSADVVDGGAGTDTVALTGTTTVAATNFDNVSNIEIISVTHTTTNVAITTKDALVAAGAVLTFQAISLTTGVLTFNGAAETNGAFIITGGGANDAITGGAGNDTLSGGNGNDSITAGLGNDTLSGDAGNDTFTFAAVTGLTSADIVDGGAGTDTVALTANTAFTAANDFDNVQNIETVTLGNTNTAVTITTKDTLVAAGATLTLSTANTGGLIFNGAAETDGAFNITSSGLSNDTITGGAGADSIVAGTGIDTIAGGGGNDTFTFAAVTGLTSADVVDGGAGTDTVALTGNTAFAAATYFDNVQNIETITVGNTNKAVTITTQDTLVAAGATLTLSNAANSGILTFNGAAETDGAFNITGGTGNDIITGGAGNDTLIGGAGNDSLTSGAGTDSITGGTGADTITLGSSGNDNIQQTVIYSSTSDGAAAGASSGADTITQFDANANTGTDDLIKITGTFRTLLDDNSDGILDYSVSDGVDLGNQAIIGGANQEATVLLDAELEVVLADFTTVGLANLIAELGEEIDFTAIATGEEHLFIMNFSPTQTALVLYTAGIGGDDIIVSTDIQILGIVTHNDGTGLAANDLTF